MSSDGYVISCIPRSLPPCFFCLMRQTFVLMLPQRNRKPRHLGVTPPISEAFATPPEVSVTNTLVESLKEHNMFESDEEARRRWATDDVYEYSRLNSRRNCTRIFAQGHTLTIILDFTWNREVVLGKLDRMVKDFVYKISSKKLAEPIAREAGGKIFTFGSYRLGVHSAGWHLWFFFHNFFCVKFLLSWF